jgi:hypothetical protein
VAGGEVASARPEAFLIGREFAHVHPRYDGSMHMMLPPEAVDEVLAKGWGGRTRWHAAA